MSRPRALDLLHLGRPQVICAWQVGDSIVDPGPESCIETLLVGLDEAPRRLLLTHIHLDHAGAAGALVERYPGLEVCVHEIGAPHLIDPAKLLASAERLYGDEMDRLWGRVVPVPEANIRVLSGGEELDGGVQVHYTPGHASHHVTYLIGGAAFTGDVAGIVIGDEGFVLIPTPPPDIDIEAWERSLDLLTGLEPSTINVTHFGTVPAEPSVHLTLVRERLREWACIARESDQESFVSDLRARIAREAPAAADAYLQAAPPDQLWLGLDRYWRTGS